MASEKENIEDMVDAYERGYAVGFLDGKDVGIEEGKDMEREVIRDLIPQKWEH